MRSIFKLLFDVSRPRFWLYLAGPYVLGYTFGVRMIEQYFNPMFFIWWGYWFLCGNLFLYGVNDLSDRDTDAHNEKKGDEEHLLLDNDEYVVSLGVMVSAVIGIVLGMVSGNGLILFLVLLFLFLGYAYSAPPFRFKARPVIDFVSNGLYLIPGIVGYLLIFQQLPSVVVLLALWVWVGAMHLFSAVPDIASDKKVHLKTSAVVFGRNNSLVVCAVLWSVCALVLTLQGTFSVWLYGLWLYPLFALMALVKGNEKRVYWWFPWINGLLGFGFFVVMFLNYVMFR